MHKKKQSGITLIALVITIIVLLILAGVTIATLSGNNSAPQKATEAAQKDAIAGAKDEIAMETQEALLNYYNNKYVSKTSTGASGDADAQSIVAEAAGRAVTNAKSRNNELKDSSVSGTTIILKTKSYTVTGTIDTNGGITWSDSNSQGGGASGSTKITVDGEDVILTEANAKDYYGTKVKTIKVNNKDVEFGLFYVDYEGDFGEKGTVYLKAINSVDSISLSGGISDSLQKTEAVKIMKALNPEWNANRGTTVYDNFEDREKGVAYLCNPSNSTWSGIQQEFKNKYGTENVNYVVGAPSAEMFAKAINQAGGLQGTNAIDSRWFPDKISGDTTTSRYKFSGYLFSINGRNTTSNVSYDNKSISNAQKSSLTQEQQELYCSGVNQWLASPASNDWNYYVCVIESGQWLGGDYMTRSFATCPLVSLKPGVDLTTN